MNRLATIRSLGWLGCMMAICCPVFAEDGGAIGEARLDYIRAVVAQREGREPSARYGKFERVVEKAVPVLPNGKVYGGKPGKRLAQTTREAFWASESARAFALLGGHEVRTDGERISAEPPTGEFRNVEIFDGRRGWRVQIKSDGDSTLEVNSDYGQLPNLRTVTPLFAGKGLSWRWLSELLDPQSGYQAQWLCQEEVDGLKCEKVRLSGLDPGLDYDFWLAEAFDFCWARIDVARAGSAEAIIRHSASLARRADGYIYPFQMRVEHLGESAYLSVWKTLEYDSSFEKAPPPYGFAPDPADFAQVVDALAAQLVQSTGGTP